MHLNTKTNMANSYLELLTTPTLEEKQADELTPVPGESFIRYSPRVTESREQVEDLLHGRFFDMYNLSRKTQERFGLYDPAAEEEGAAPRFPSITEVADAFNPEDFTLATTYQGPALILSPPRRIYEELMSAISLNGGLEMRHGPRIHNPGYSGSDTGGYYRAFITEAASVIEPGDDFLDRSLLSRIGYRLETRLPGEWGMTRDLYPLLVAQSILRGQMIDRKNFTVLDGEPIVENNAMPDRPDEPFIINSLVPVGHCRKQRPTIEWFSARIKCADRGRFRRVLGGRNIIGSE